MNYGRLYLLNWKMTFTFLKKLFNRFFTISLINGTKRSLRVLTLGAVLYGLYFLNIKKLFILNPKNQYYMDLKVVVYPRVHCLSGSNINCCHNMLYIEFLFVSNIIWSILLFYYFYSICFACWLHIPLKTFYTLETNVTVKFWLGVLLI